MYFLAFLLLVWLLLAGVAHAGWMLHDAWRKGNSITESSSGPSKGQWLCRLLPTKEIASQVIVALGVCAVVGYALQLILRDESFQTARDMTVSWVASRDPDERADEEPDGRIPDRLFRHDVLRPGRPVYGANVGGLPITDEDLQWMTQRHPDLEWVVLSGTKLTDDGLTSLSRLNNLQTLGLDYTRLTDAGLAQLATLMNLRKLSLDGCQISDAGIAHLRLLGNLRELSLRGTLVTDAGLASLTSLNELEKLDLSGTAITEAGLRHLENLPELQNVHLDKTAIPQETRARFRNR